MADLRVFKLRGTNPQADVAGITYDLPKMTIDEVGIRLRKFSQKFMPDALMASRLADEDLYRNPGLPIILLEAEERARKAVGQTDLKFIDLVRLPPRCLEWVAACCPLPRQSEVPTSQPFLGSAEGGRFFVPA